MFFNKYIKQTYPKPYISMTRIGFKICYAWENSIYETLYPTLQGVSDSHQI